MLGATVNVILDAPAAAAAAATSSLSKLNPNAKCFTPLNPNAKEFRPSSQSSPETPAMETDVSLKSVADRKSTPWIVKSGDVDADLNGDTSVDDCDIDEEDGEANLSLPEQKEFLNW